MDTKGNLKPFGGLASNPSQPPRREPMGSVTMLVTTQAMRERRPDSDNQAFREAHRLLVAFGVAAVPATLLLCVMGGDFFEGDAGSAGTLAMACAGGMPIVCAVASVVARRLWAAGKPLVYVLAVMCWPPVLVLVTVFLSMLAFAMESTFLLQKP